nr:MAG TPA: hypothetical protein [Caudoviricetes sp.]
MNYTIATTKEVHGNLRLCIDKSGNEYTVGLFNDVTKEYTHRSFKTIDDALTVYKTLVELIVKGYGTEEYKRNVLKGDKNNG